MLFWKFVLSENFTALILAQMKILDVAQDRGQDVNLRPVKSHVNQY